MAGKAQTAFQLEKDVELLVEKIGEIQTSMENLSATIHEYIPSEEHPLTQTQLPGGSLAFSITEMLQELSPLSPNCYIYRVNLGLRQVNPRAYTPNVVSIGPLHRDKKELRAMEEHKLRYLQTFLSLANLKIEDCVNRVSTWVDYARRCYAETIEQTNDEFAKMILVDGCFVVMVLMFSHCRKLIQRGDRLFHQPHLMNEVVTDMVLLENQLPFFVIEGLYKLFISSRNEISCDLGSIKNLIYKFLKRLIPISKPPKVNDIPQVSHLVDFVRFFYHPISQTPRPRALDLPKAPDLDVPSMAYESFPGSSSLDLDVCKMAYESSPGSSSPCLMAYQNFPGRSSLDTGKLPESFTVSSSPDTEKIVLSIPSATSLHAAGVRFKSAEENPPMDIKFADGVLEIPHLIIDDRSEIIFRNVVAFEQLHLDDSGWYMSTYLGLLDKLIDTPYDVDLLVKDGVIHNNLGSNKDVCELFNKIVTNVSFDDMTHFNRTCKDLKVYYKIPWHEWKATLKHDYLNTPWKVIGIMVAFFLLVLTFIQAVSSILSLYVQNTPKS